jgi:RNA ligase (TIGR02306 family)
VSYCPEPLQSTKSTHRAEVVPVAMDPHPNADTLSVVKVWGYEVVVKSSDWAGINKAVYVVPDSVVDVRRPEFAFLAQDAKGDMTARIKARRLRGVVSYGLLVPAPSDANVGEDWSPRLGVTRYEPPEPGDGGGGSKFLIGGEEESPPDCPTGPNKYDVEAFERYHDVFAEGEPVFLSEKLDGANARFVFWGGRFYVKSRNRWVKRTPDYSHVTVEHLVEKGMPADKAVAIVDGLKSKPVQVNGFWRTMEQCAPIAEYLRNNPGTVVFGESYGSSGRLKYGLVGGSRFAAFDVYRSNVSLGSRRW